MSAPTLKIRPYLTLQETNLLLDLLQPHLTTAPSYKVLYDNLNQFVIKANAGLLKGSYTTKPKQSLHNQLGFSDSEDMSDEEEAALLSQLNQI